MLKALRKQEKYDEALKQVDQLIQENPRALEPLMEKGRILEAWAEKDPTKFDQAVGHWATLRTRLQPMKKKPGEYYEVMYNVAKCLVREAEKSADKAVALDRAKKAEQVLKAALVLSPKLNGPDTVAKYKVLLDKAITMQGRSPSPKVRDERREEVVSGPARGVLLHVIVQRCRLLRVRKIMSPENSRELTAPGGKRENTLLPGAVSSRLFRYRLSAVR